MHGFMIRMVILTLAWSTVACTDRRGRRLEVGEPRADRTLETVSFLGRPLFAEVVGGDPAELNFNLEKVRAELLAEPDDPERIVWLARRLGYLWRMNEAVDVLTRGIQRFPDHAPFYRHRGHRYVSLRRFDDAIADLETATRLIEGRPDEIEPDGAPNTRGIPLTTTGFNVWYHLALARYLKGEYESSLAAWREAMRHNRNLDDNLVAVTDWMYMTLCRLGRNAEAKAILEPIRMEMNIIENVAYHRRLLLYKGLIQADELINLDRASELDLATLGYGLGFWYHRQGEFAKAREIWRRVVDGPYWPAFGFIAAEVELVDEIGGNRR